MNTHNKGFYEELTKIIFQLSSNTQLIYFSETVSITFESLHGKYNILDFTFSKDSDHPRYQLA